MEDDESINITKCPPGKAKGYIPSDKNYKSKKTPQSQGIDKVRLGRWDLGKNYKKKKAAYRAYVDRSRLEYYEKDKTDKS